MSDTAYWLKLILAKSPEAWFSIIGGSAYVWYRSGALSRFGRACEAGISGLISLALGPDISVVTGYPPVFVHFAIAVFGFLILDVFTSVISDKTELKNIVMAFIRKWVGVPKDPKDKG